MFRVFWVALVATAGFAGSLGAQAPTGSPKGPPPRPDHRSLRFDESWASANRTSAWSDAIKAIPLAGTRPVQLTVGGQLRWREEFMRAFNVGAQNDDYGQSRLLISADLVAGRRARWYGRGFVEARDAQSYGRTLPGGTRPTDADRHDVQNLFAEFGRGRSFVRYGRQEIALGRERLIGVPDWSNTRRGTEGVRAQMVQRKVALEAMAFRPLVVQQTRANHADSTARVVVLAIGNAPGATAAFRGAPATWQLYRYEQRLHSPSTDARRITSGTRVQWQQTSTARLRSLEVEAAMQTGHTGARSLNAAFWVVEALQQWKRVAGAPSLAIGLEEATGERAATTGTVEAFAVLYPAAHAHGGYADVLGRPNVREWHAIGTWAPVKPLDLRLAAYRFDRRRLDDGVYTKQNTVFRAAGRSNARHVADEVDLTGTRKFTRHLRGIAGAAVVPPGEYLRATTGGGRTERWAFLGTTYTF